MKPEPGQKNTDLPFPKRWLYYIAIKIILLAGLAYGVLRWKGLL
jgi:hypothetical protein